MRPRVARAATLGDGMPPVFPPQLTTDYEPLRPLGKGGMGAVWLAREIRLDREVAVKVLQVVEDEEARQRFQREAAVLSRLKHPAIVQFYDVGMAGDRPYIVLEPVEGRTLEEIVKEGNDPLKPKFDPLPIMLQIAEGLEEVHRCGVIHRDVKPANVMVTGDGRGVLVDFGLVYDPSRTGITRSRALTGTLGFVPPEVLQGETVGPASDWYAWGVTLYYALEGQLPYRAEELLGVCKGAALPTATFRRVARGDPRARLARAAMHREPERRPASRLEAEDLLDAGLDAPSRARKRRRGKPAKNWMLRFAMGAAFGGFLLFWVLVAIGWVITPPHEREALLRGEPVAPPPFLQEQPAPSEGADPGPVEAPDPTPARPDLPVVSSPPSAVESTPRRLWKELGVEGLADSIWYRNAFERVEFSPRGEWISVAGLGDEVGLFDASTGASLVRLGGHDGETTVATFAPGGDRLVSTSLGGTMRLWQVLEGGEALDPVTRGQTFRPVATARAEQGGFVCASISPDGKHVAAGTTGGQIQVFRLPGLEPERSFQGHPGPVEHLRYSSRGDQLASCGGDMQVLVWDLASGQVTRRLKGPWGVGQSPVFAPDDSFLVTGHFDGTARIWDMKTGALRHQLGGHELQVTSIALGPGASWLATGSWDRSVRIWDTSTGEARRMTRDETAPVASVAVSPDGLRIVYATRRGRVRMLDAVTLKEVRTLVDEILEAPAEAEAAAATTPTRTLRGHEGTVRALAYRRDGQLLASGGKDGGVRLWDLRREGEPVVLRGHEGEVRALAFDRRGAHLASGGEDGQALIWDLQDRAVLATFGGHGGWVEALAFVPGGEYLVTGARDAALRLWKTGEDTPVGSFPKPGAPPRAVAMSADGKVVIAAGADGFVRVWGAGSKAARRLRGHEGEVLSVALAPGATLAASGGADGTVRLWRLPGGDPVKVLEGHKDKVSGVAFMAGDEALVSASWDGSLRFWDLEAGRTRHSFDTGGPIESMALRRDAGEVATGDWEGRIRTWRPPPR